MLIGHVGAEPTCKTLDKGIAMAQVRLATTEKGYTTSSGQQIPDRTEWHNLIFWRKLAEIVQKYIHKGDKLFIEGKIQSREYEKDNVKHKITDIVVDNMEILSPRQQVQNQSQPTPPPPPPVEQGDIPF